MPKLDLLVNHIFTLTSIYDIFESQAWIQLKSASPNPFPWELSAIEGHCTATMPGTVAISCPPNSFGIVVPLIYLFTHSSWISSLIPLVDSSNLVRFLYPSICPLPLTPRHRGFVSNTGGATELELLNAIPCLYLNTIHSLATPLPPCLHSRVFSTLPPISPLLLWPFFSHLAPSLSLYFSESLACLPPSILFLYGIYNFFCFPHHTIMEWSVYTSVLPNGQCAPRGGAMGSIFCPVHRHHLSG